MGARACSRFVVLVGLAVGGMCLTTPSTPVSDGIGVAQARSYSRKGGYRHRGSRRVTWRRRGGSDARLAALVALPPERPGFDGDRTGAEAGDDGRWQPLRAALQVRASALAGEPAPVVPERPAAVPESPAPTSVSFDFEAGLKTTRFEGGVEVREPFDVAAARRLAAPPPAGAGGRPSGPSS